MDIFNEVTDLLEAVGHVAAAVSENDLTADSEEIVKLLEKADALSRKILDSFSRADIRVPRDLL
jgi:hypothetical protein